MLLDASLSFLHFTAVLILVSALAGEAFVLRLPMNAPVIRLLLRMDMFYGASAGALLAVGFLRVFFGLRDESYYWAQPFFWAKIGTFLAVGLLSIAPTRRFFAWARTLKKDSGYLPPEAQVRGARRIVMIEVHLLALVVLFAVLMARGIGFS
jgi:putative membrane protein